ncbi:MAG: LLM class F420-dependent oxidoreductase [Actinomycetota bacterium]|nr:LLM class F420-dependent oxidoreductase [Actinomycetota bacterium]MDG1488791.1 LLM class F420-dependent oxidoreductase [Actinomycetota bacterium]
MDFRIFTEPQQGATYSDLLAAALMAEESGFDAFFRSDHWLAMGDSDGFPGPTDAWITLGGLARETKKIRLGTLVNSATFRMPGPLAISVAQVDEMSAGRIELGLGAGWYEQEHAAYGIPFPALRDRFDILEEQLEIITGLWATEIGDHYDFQGRHYSLVNSPALPKPFQKNGPPIIIGGGGQRRTPRLAAAYADEFNLPFRSIETFKKQKNRVIKACETIDRDPSELTYSVALVACIGSTDNEIAARAEAIGRDVKELRENGLTGTPAEALETLQKWHDAGAERMYLQVLNLEDLDHIGLMGHEFIGQL